MILANKGFKKERDRRVVDRIYRDLGVHEEIDSDSFSYLKIKLRDMYSDIVKLDKKETRRFCKTFKKKKSGQIPINGGRMRVPFQGMPTSTTTINSLCLLRRWAGGSSDRRTANTKKGERSDSFALCWMEAPTFCLP